MTQSDPRIGIDLDSFYALLLIIITNHSTYIILKINTSWIEGIFGMSL